ncbi:hypothetical protein ACFPK9_05315 [Rubritalea spongiae]|uniref:Type II secretion system protein n=1 Tax=Rubritalea spongiae TaxID=430797 RepID=A0ABW5E7D1_9BACT
MKTNRHNRNGFMLMEALIAFSIFGIAATGIIIALHRTAELSQAVIHEQWVTQEAHNLLTEIITAPDTGNGFAREETVTIDGGTEALISIELIEDVSNQDEELLENLYRVSVTIYWDDNGNPAEETFTIVHLDGMFTNR